MEKDGITRLYAVNGDRQVYLEWPEGPADKPLPVQAAREAIMRADIEVVSVIQGGIGSWIVINAGDHEISPGNRILPMEGSGTERYAHLADAVEKLLEKSGVTILFG